jgi:hypothetical protein
MTFRQQRYCDMPKGRLLYRTAERSMYVVVRRVDRPGFWLVEDGWTRESVAAGPFRPNDILRAYRLANVLVPEGCERGPWQTALSAFWRFQLPRHANDWSIVDPRDLDPSFSFYEERDISSVRNERCCAAPADSPNVEWTSNGVDAFQQEVLATFVGGRCPQFRVREAGVLKKEWNCHPQGSPVYAASRLLTTGFVVMDCPVVPGSDCLPR